MNFLIWLMKKTLLTSSEVCAFRNVPDQLGDVDGWAAARHLGPPGGGF
jgi:hypothetical protein